MKMFTGTWKGFAFIFSFIISGYSLIAQNSYYSIQAGTWENNTNVWSKVSQTGTACSCTPGTTLGNSNNAYIYNNITATTLTAQSGSAKITVESGNTLTITTTTFAMSGSAIITVNAGGTLIFNANVTMAGGTGITNNGTVIVNSNITNSGSAVVTNNGTMNVYGNITTSGGASFGGTGTTYATGTVSGPGTSGVSVLPAFFSSFTNASGTGLVTYSSNPLAFNALQFNNNASTVLTGAGTFVPFPTQSISGTVNYVPLYTGTNSLGNSPISVVDGVAGVQYDTALAGMNFYSNGIIRLGGKYGYGISIQSNGDGINLYDNSPITINSVNGSLNLESNADATLISSYGHGAIIGNDVIIQATGHADTGKHVYLIGSFPLAGNTDSILSRNPSTGRITEIAKSSLMSSPAWSLTGNAGTVDGTDFIGTTDNVPFTIRTNNAPSLRLDPVLNTTFVGLYAGNPSVTGGNNIAIGYSALGSVTSGYGNIASGYGALTSNTSGSYNVSIGYNALRYNNTDGNVAVGYTALQANTIGGGNAAMGYGALSSSNAPYNTAFGAYAGNQITTGAYNTAIGGHALYSNTTGSNNTAIGYGADVGSGNLTNATAIGYMASVNTNNSIVLGGTGANAVNVGIGTNSPTQTLSVTGTLNYTDGNQGLNKVLASDGNGNATWKSLNSLQGNSNKAPVMTVTGVNSTPNYIPYWADASSDLGNSSMYFDGQNYGINTTTPNSLFNIDLGIPNGDEIAGVPMFSISYQYVANGGSGNDPNVFTVDAAGNTTIAGYTNIGVPPTSYNLGTLVVNSPSTSNSPYSALLVGAAPNNSYGALIGLTDLNQIALGVKYTNPNSSLNGTDYFQLHCNGNMFDAGQVTIGNSLSTPDAQLNVSFNTNNPPPAYELAIVNTTSTPTDVFTVDQNGNVNTSGGYFINHQPLTINPWLQTTYGASNVVYYGDGTTNYQVGIGTSKPDPNVILDVYGIERATEIRVCPDQTCDFVFDKDYNLMSLDTLNAYLKSNHHLPGIASAKEMKSEGSISLGKMNMQLLQKVEELTLYTIQQKDKAKAQDEKIEKQDEKIKELEAKLDLLLKQSQK
jgi:hypothetical protein